MSIRSAFSFVALAAKFVSSGWAATPDFTIDNFASGPYASPQYAGGQYSNTQTGNMLGGQRAPSILVCLPSPCPANNLFNQGASYEIRPPNAYAPGAIVYNSGYGVAPRLDVAWGSSSNPLHHNFAVYDRFRVSFNGLDQYLNFNIQVFTGTSWGQLGCNLAPYPRPFSVELPFNLFVGPGFNPASVDSIGLIFQSSSPIGALDFAVTKVEASATQAPSPVISCHY